MRERVVRGLQTLIDGNSAILCRIDARRGAIKILADSIGPELIQYQEPAAALKHEHSRLSARYGTPHWRGDGSGGCGPAPTMEMHWDLQRGLFESGHARATGARVPFGEPDYLSLVVNRSRRSFTARDHHVMDILRHHVAEAFRLPPPSFSTLPTFARSIGVGQSAEV